MASEIQGNFTLTVTNGSFTDSKTWNFLADQAAARESKSVQNIAAGGTAGVALVFAAGVAVLGWSYFVNLDAVNFVEIGVQVAGVFAPLLMLKGGAAGKKEGFMVRLAQIGPTNAIFARANTAPVDLEFGVLSN